MDQLALYLSSYKQFACDTLDVHSFRYYMAEQKEESNEVVGHSDEFLVDYTAVVDRPHRHYQHCTNPITLWLDQTARLLSYSPSEYPLCCSNYFQSKEFRSIDPISCNGLQQGMDDKVAILDTLPCYSLGRATTAASTAATIKFAETIAKELSAGVYGRDLSSCLRLFQLLGQGHQL